MTTINTRRATVTAEGEKNIRIVREFDAPAALVFRAWTEPDLVSRWWHTGRGEMRVCEIDLRVGGRWRWVMETADGTEVGFHGEYREIVPGERLVSTEAYEGLPDADANASLNTLTLTERDGVTTLDILVEHVAAEHRDGHLASGMESGLQDALALLENAVRSLR